MTSSTTPSAACSTCSASRPSWSNAGKANRWVTENNREDFMDQKTYDVGMKMRRQVAGNEYVDKAMANVDDFNRDFQRIVTQYCWGEAWGDDTLPPRERSILNLGMIASLGRMEEFQTHVRRALNNGMTPNEIRAVLTQIAVYCGIPAGGDCFRQAKPIIEAWQKNKK